jgi:hypothetical protein
MRIRSARRPEKKSSKAGSARRRKAVRVRNDLSPYSAKPSLQKVNIDIIAGFLRRYPQKFSTAKLTLLEVADRILAREVQMPRPARLKAHMVFEMLARPSGRVRAGVTGACLEWRGAYKGGFPIVTTVNAQQGNRLNVDARKYILENPARGKRRNFRTIPQNICGNEKCVNPRHIRMVPINPDSHQGENHPRSKFTDKQVVKMVKEYNAGSTAREIARKYDIQLTYVEQIMRKEKRTEATEGLKIRGRFGFR